jgi:AAA+ superfamily predicted ATPase
MSALPYQNNAQLVQALQTYAQALIAHSLQRRTAENAANQLDQLLQQVTLAPLVAPVTASVEQLWQALQEAIAASVRAGIFSPWIHLQQLFKLSRKEQELLCFALLAAIEPKIAAIINNIVRTPDQLAKATLAPKLDLAGISAVLANTEADAQALQIALLDDASLRYWDLISLHDTDVADAQACYQITPTLLAYLQAKAAPQLRFEEALSLFASQRPLAEHLIEARALAQLTRFRECLQQGQGEHGFLLHIQSADMALARSLSAACFDVLGLACALLDGREIWQQWQNQARQRSPLLRRVRVLCRDAMLCNRVLVLHQCQWLCAQEGGEDLLDDVLRVLLESQSCIALLNGPARRISDVALRFDNHRVVALLIKLGVPDATLRAQIWQRYAPEFGVQLDAPLLAQLVNSYQFSEEQIQLVLKEVAAKQFLNTASGTETALLDICREQSNREVMTVAQEVRTAWQMSDIVLNADTRSAMQEVLQYAKQRHQVIEQWGFAEKNQNSRNLCVLFYGPSGTGKTMAASIIANELNLGLYRIDLANIISKYIGETEKHLAQLFDQAEAMNIVLFFDEAESLFSARTETKDAHDRYANLQTGYLLQRIESYPGIVILSTNLLGNIDKAFTRRFKFMIEYPFPEPEQRLQLWRNAFPAATPLAADVDFTVLAERAALSGGSINNIAVSAAFLAASDKRSVSQNDLLKATEREYNKLAKVFHKSDFLWNE